MSTLTEQVASIRSKNAGPFWATIDLFFKDDVAFEYTASRLTTRAIAERLDLAEDQLKRFDLPDIRVIKISFPRPVVQGHIQDRDMHGAQYAWLLADIQLG